MRWKLPTYRLHKSSGRAVVQFKPLYGPKRKYLNGAYGSRESRDHFASILAECNAWIRRQNGSERRSNLTVAELAVSWLQYCYEHYGAGDKESHSCARAVRDLIDKRQPWWNSPAESFGPLALKVVRERMVEAGLARTNINHHVDRVRRCFRWGASEQLVSASVLTALKTVPGLRKGKTEAKEARAIEPVDDRWPMETIKFLPAPLAALVRVQMLTGMRSDELTSIRGEAIDTTGDVWLYQPEHHKNAWRAKDGQPKKPKIIPIGPQAQAVLKPFLRDGYLVTPALCSRQRDNFRERYEAHSYHQAIRHALRKAAKNGVLIRGWHPHQLRHLRATVTRRLYGVEGAKAELGNTMQATEIYAERSVELAVRIARETG